MADAMEGVHRRVSLFEIMSAVDGGKSSLAGVTLDAVLNSAHRSQLQQTQPPPQPPQQRPSRSKTLLDIIKDEGPDRDRRTWKHIREKLRLKRAGDAWINTVPIPASDTPIRNNNAFRSGPRLAFHFEASTSADEVIEHVPISDPPVNSTPCQSSRRSSVCHGHNPLDPSDEDQPDSAGRGDGSGRRLLGAALAEERQLSAREAAAAQEAAEAAAAAAAVAAAEARETENEAAEGEVLPLSVSLMDLMGDYGDEDDDGDDDAMVEEMNGGIEQTCCVCLLRHKGAAFIPCGHTFCRVCSRELFVQRGNCPLCNNFIVEILDIF